MHVRSPQLLSVVVIYSRTELPIYPGHESVKATKPHFLADNIKEPKHPPHIVIRIVEDFHVMKIMIHLSTPKIKGQLREQMIDSDLPPSIIFME